MVVRREEWGDKCLSWVMAWCLVYWTPSLWVPGSMPRQKFIFPFFSFLTCVNRVIITTSRFLSTAQGTVSANGNTQIVHTDLHCMYAYPLLFLKNSSSKEPVENEVGNSSLFSIGSDGLCSSCCDRA